MKALSVSEAKMKLSGLIDTVNTTDEERRGGGWMKRSEGGVDG